MLLRPAQRLSRPLVPAAKAAEAAEAAEAAKAAKGGEAAKAMDDGCVVGVSFVLKRSSSSGASQRRRLVGRCRRLVAARRRTSAPASPTRTSLAGSRRCGSARPCSTVQPCSPSSWLEQPNAAVSSDGTGVTPEETLMLRRESEMRALRPLCYLPGSSLSPSSRSVRLEVGLSSGPVRYCSDGEGTCACVLAALAAARQLRWRALAPCGWR